MPFSLTNAPAVFQHLMNEVFFDFLDLFCVVYLDDILVYSEDSESHAIHVKQVLNRLKENHLYAKLEKCEFSKTSVEFLGYIISNNGLGTGQSVILCILFKSIPNPSLEIMYPRNSTDVLENSHFSSLV